MFTSPNSGHHVHCLGFHTMSAAKSNVDYSGWTKAKLQTECKARGIKYGSNLVKSDLLLLLQASDKERRKRPASCEPSPARDPKEARPDVPFMHEAGSEFDCPICYQTMLPPMYLCATGHSICSNCLAKLPQRLCPSCGVAYSNPVGRNFQMEAMLENRIVRCPHAPCSVKRRYGDEAMKTHIRKCVHRPVRCRDCSYEGASTEVGSHMVAQHKAIHIQMSYVRPTLVACQVRTSPHI